MERKLVKQGNNALTVTLPHEWIKAKGLVAGDTIMFATINEQLSIQADKKTTVASISLDLTHTTEKEMWHILQSHYIRGIDRFEITHKNASLIQQICETSFTGFMIEKHTATKSILQSIVSTPQDSLDAILKRIYFMFIELSEKLVLVQKGELSSPDIRKYGWLVDKHILYCMRYLTKYEQLEKNYRYFLLLAVLEEAGDILTLLADHITKKDDVILLAKNVSLYIHAMIRSDHKKVFTILRGAKSALGEKTFVDGLTRSFYECLYNFSGYLIE